MTRRAWYSRNTSPLDEVAAERLLRGQLPSVGASSDEQALAKLLAAASAPPSVHELSGEPRAVNRIRVELLDKSRKVLASSTITRLPAEARMTLTNKTAYYRVIVEYINGTATSVVSPL